MSSRSNWESVYWPSATLLGFVLTYGLFLFVPTLEGHAEPKIHEVIELDFVQWQAPLPEAPLTPEAKPEPVKKEVVKPQPKPVPDKPKPTPPKPVLTQAEPEPKPDPEEQTPLQEITSEPVVAEAPVTPIEPEFIETPVVESPPDTSPQPMPEALPAPVSLAKLTAMPRFLHKQAPIYPPTMRAIGKQATVKLVVLIDGKGTIRNIDIKKSAGEAFDQAAISAIRNSRFMAGEVNGQPVTVLLNVPVRFTLR